MPLPKHISIPSASDEMSPAELLRVLNKDKASNLDVAHKIALNIRKPEYTLRHFHDDLTSAFPELTYYMIADSKVSSGGTPVSEYLRTMGAAFAVYWLMRIGMDGERGFCFGVDEAWRPNPPPTGHTGAPSGNFFSLKDPERRLAFYYKAPWGMLNQLMVDAGCLVPNASPGAKDDTPGKSIARQLSATTKGWGWGGKKGTEPDGPSGIQPDAWKVDAERTVAMLVLTAIHDIMKVESLLPTVSKQYAPYRGFEAGDRINDHDVALAFILETFGSELPSFSGIPARQQRTITFTQSKIGFNHGWLVQAEAPPSALFSKFKDVITTDGASPADVAFYFVHWLTDLAGAEPAPLHGSEKFVLKFPHFVLESFIESFPVIHRLANSTETEVFEQYLLQRWEELPEDLGPFPKGDDAIALARLVVQAQNAREQQSVAAAFRGQLSVGDRETLACEMALTGIAGQGFQSSGQHLIGMGPAFLVYYSPAFLRTVAKSHPLAALQILACIYRGARELWPFDTRDGASPSPTTNCLPSLRALAERPAALERRPSEKPRASMQYSSQVAELGTVTVRIDQIKDMDTERLREADRNGDRWYIARSNAVEAVLVRHNPSQQAPPAELDESKATFRELPIVQSFMPSALTGGAVDVPWESGAGNGEVTA